MPDNTTPAVKGQLVDGRALIADGMHHQAGGDIQGLLRRSGNQLALVVAHQFGTLRLYAADLAVIGFETGRAGIEHEADALAVALRAGGNLAQQAEVLACFGELGLLQLFFGSIVQL